MSECCHRCARNNNHNNLIHIGGETDWYGNDREGTVERFPKEGATQIVGVYGDMHCSDNKWRDLKLQTIGFLTATNPAVELTDLVIRNKPQPNYSVVETFNLINQDLNEPLTVKSKYEWKYKSRQAFSFSFGLKIGTSVTVKTGMEFMGFKVRQRNICVARCSLICACMLVGWCGSSGVLVI
jgi:hypothetical protein